MNYNVKLSRSIGLILGREDSKPGIFETSSRFTHCRLCIALIYWKLGAVTTTLKTLFQVNQRSVKFALAKLFTIPCRLRRNRGDFCISSLRPYALGTEQCKPTPYVSLSWCNSNKDTFLVHEYRISMNVPTVGLPHSVNHRSHFYQTWLSNFLANLAAYYIT